LSLEAASSAERPCSPDFRPDKTSAEEIECHFTFKPHFWKEGNYGNCSYSYRKWSIIDDFSWAGLKIIGGGSSIRASAINSANKFISASG
jgi:hypothetical protein